MPSVDNNVPPIITSLEEQLQFEAFISDLSARFINLPPNEVDNWVDQGLKQVVEFLGVDRGSLMQLLGENKVPVVTHSYSKPGFPPLTKMTDVPGASFPWSCLKILNGEILSFSSPDEFPPEARVDRESMAALNMKSHIIIPLSIGGSIQGVLAVGSLTVAKVWPPAMVSRMRLIGEILVNALDRKRREAELHRTLEEIQQLKKQAEAENIYLRESMTLESGPDEISGQSPAIQKVLAQIKKVAPTNSTILLEGETGVGKEVFARLIHKLSTRKNRVMVVVNCAALPATLIESELFGRESGAYTGALSKQIGRFEIANGSTILLDEIGELSLELQTKLLRVLQEGEFERLGNPKKIKVDVRVIAATNRDLTEEVRQGHFRKDLYYRLRVFPIYIPPLRERREDIPLLVQLFVNEFAQKMGKNIQTISRKSLDALQGYPWTGNIRELRNVVEYAMIINSGSKLYIPLPQETTTTDLPLQTLAEVEKQHILKVLEQTNWRIKGTFGAAEILGLNSSTLYFKMKKMNIPLQRHKGQP